MSNPLSFNRFVYEVFVSNLLEKKSVLSKNDLLREIERIASDATFNFNGLLSDQRLEFLLNAVGKEIKTHENFEKKEKSVSFNVLHIATTLYNVGGHTRVIKNWISQDSVNGNSLIVTNQDVELDLELEECFENCVKFEKIETNLSLLDKSIFLREFILENAFDFVVLHIHPHDVVPVVALSSDLMPPVLFYNHSDHLFSLGVSVSDLFIDFRDKGMQFSLSKRGAQKSVVIPYPLENRNVNITKLEARNQLSISSDDVVLITMASAHKYKPVDNLNFFLTISSFLEKHPDIKFYAIGVDIDEYKSFTNCYQKPDNLFLVGKVTNPVAYLAAADYFLESYPFGTGLGVFDAVQYGAFPIFSPHDYSIYAGSADNIFPSYLTVYKDIINRDFDCELYKEVSSGFLKKKYLESFEGYLKKCLHPEWIDDVYRIYSSLDGCQHHVISNFKNCPLNDESAFKFSKIWRNHSFFDRILLLKGFQLTILNKVWICSRFFLELLLPLKEVSLRKLVYFRSNLWVLRALLLQK